MLGIKFPVFQGGMGNISDPALAASVSNAGGLGTIGAGTLPVAEIEKRMDKMRSLAASPCCVNIAISVHPNASEVIRLAIEKKFICRQPFKIYPGFASKRHKSDLCLLHCPPGEKSGSSGG